MCLAQPLDVVKMWGRDRQYHAIHGVALGEGVGDDVLGARLVLDDEVKAKELADPMVLRDRCKALVEEELQAIVVSPDGEAPAPEVRPPMPDGVNEADQFPLVSGERPVPRRGGAAEVGDGVFVLQQHRVEAMRQGVTLHHEGPGEVGQRQYQSRGDGGLEGLERRCGVSGPGEAALLQKGRQWSGDGAVVVDKLAVVSRQAQESPDRPSGTRLRPVSDRLDLGGIHGDAGVGDDVAEVGDGGFPEGALRAFDEQVVLLQHAEDGSKMEKVVGPR